MSLDKLLSELEQARLEATQTEWTGTSNIPFYATLNKPAPSLSKHDTPNSPHWKIEDVKFVLLSVNHIIDLIKAARVIKSSLESAHFVCTQRDYKGMALAIENALAEANKICENKK